MSPAKSVDIGVLYAHTVDDIDAIRSFSLHLADAIESSSPLTASVLMRKRLGQWIQWESATGNEGGRLRGLQHAQAVVLQYNPFSYGRWGLTPSLPLELAYLRSVRNRPLIALMVHEPYVPVFGLPWLVLRAYHVAQFLALWAAADVVLTSTELWGPFLAQCRPQRPVRHVPAGSNLPDMRHRRNATRAELGVYDDTLVLATFGRGNPARLIGHVERAVGEVSKRHARVAVLNLGAQSPPLSAIDPTIPVYAPGSLPDDRVAAYLSAADLILLPFDDGASTRRSALISAMQHGLPIISTSRRLTDAVLRDSPEAMCLVPSSQAGRFAACAAELAGDSERRRRMARAARALYEREFSWPRIAEKLICSVGSGGGAEGSSTVGGQTGA
jgi:glycosyltransferase involved in cell wall biosynthesis